MWWTVRSGHPVRSSVRRPGGGRAHGRRWRGGDGRRWRGGDGRRWRGGDRRRWRGAVLGGRRRVRDGLARFRCGSGRRDDSRSRWRWWRLGCISRAALRNGHGFRRGNAGGGRCTASLVAGTGSLGLAGSSRRRRYAGRQRRDDTQWPVRAAGQPASGRRHGDGDGGARAGLHRPRRCGLPQPQRHPRCRHRHRRGRGQQPRRQQPPEPVPAGPPDAGPALAGRDRRGGEPVAERIRLAGRPPPPGIGIGRGHGRCGPEPHGSPPNPRRARLAGSPSWWQSVRSACRTVTVPIGR